MTDSPETIVGRQLDAYNARDIDAFMACWADDAEIYQFPLTLLAKGADAIRARHVARFQEADLHGALIARMRMGGYVVDREQVTRNLPEGKARIEVTAIYEVADGRVAKAWFLNGETTPLG